MIELSPLARPYANAVFSTALDNNQQDRVGEDLSMLGLVVSTPEVLNIIENPEQTKTQIAKVIIDLTSDQICEITTKLINLLAENKRLNLIEAIATHYHELLEKNNQTTSISVGVATTPTEETRAEITSKLLASHGEGSSIEFFEDLTLMGGLSIKIGDESLDLSIKGKVKKLVNQLNF